MDYKIIAARWLDTEHKNVGLQIEDSAQTVYPYTLIADNTEPLAQRLWQQLNDNESNITIDGYVPLDTSIHTPSPAEEANTARIAINERRDQQLELLTCPYALARAEFDEDFAAQRKELMRQWLTIEQQEGYPLDVEYPEIIGDLFIHGAPQ